MLMKREVHLVRKPSEAMNRGEDRLFYHAPAVMIAHAESWDSSSPFNCSVALYNCSLMAHTLKLGCCFNGFLVNAVNHDRKIKRWLGIPADHRCYSAMGLGYPNIKYERLVQRHPPKVMWRYNNPDVATGGIRRGSRSRRI